jgi:hypothetical protein
MIEANEKSGSCVRTPTQFDMVIERLNECVTRISNTEETLENRLAIFSRVEEKDKRLSELQKSISAIANDEIPVAIERIHKACEGLDYIECKLNIVIESLGI